jgi:nitroimidazol reductase NimA-like FMN-containing flavoprotein (pyridoxamine 5'-phosphate oxidase superfamily)
LTQDKANLGYRVISVDKTRQSNRTTLKRAVDRGHHDSETIYGILDATPLCHIGFVTESGPIVTPTVHWRAGNQIFWHGSRISRTMQESEQAEVCVTVTLLDGLVLARSAFHHSANYRSVMIIGKPKLVEEREAKIHALKGLVEVFTPVRWDTLRPMSEKELSATSVLSLELNEASAKIRNGGPKDLEQDMSFPVWAGVVPFTTQTNNPVPCQYNMDEVTEPENLKDYRIG